MQYIPLGKTGITVSRLCFGTLTVGPLQARLPLEESARVLSRAIAGGVSFFDTAQLYGTYPCLRRAMEETGKYDLVISAKTYAHTRELAIAAFEEARKELDRDVIDIFMLHEQESEHTLRGHREALEFLREQKSKGNIRAVGISTHRVSGARAAVKHGLDILHPLLNKNGLGIEDGGREAMEEAVREAHEAGLGVFSMKPLGGGNLFKEAEACLNYILSLPYIDSVALGMQSVEEVAANIGFFEGGGFSAKAKLALAGKTRRLHIDSWCEGCGECARRCGQGALRVAQGKAVCDHVRCVLCGYCSASCPAWAIKVV
ncbi:MAG: aldo/keto reductase [Oscillospiraceae bacterium]|jgi:aryl-alcohol dehydrogenase-like predicted oxidoreductase|nr:aldo/keto reductase [Oscillospiraceae bacterium]